MKPGCLIIARPSVDLGNFLIFAQKCLGKNLAAKADERGLPLPDGLKFMQCLTEMGIPQPLGHASYSVLLVCDAYELLPALSCVHGLAIATTELRTGAAFTVLSGALDNWAVSTISGLSLRSDIWAEIDRVFKADKIDLCSLIAPSQAVAKLPRMS